MREKDSEGIEGLLSHLFCVAMGYIFQCMHSAGKLPQIKVKCGSFIVFPACSGWFKSQGRNFTRGTVFHSITISLQEGIVSLSLHCCYPPPFLFLFTLSHSVLKILKEFDP